MFLTDNSTETFWESGDEDRNKLKTISITCQGQANPKMIYVHIDNTRDLGVSTSFFLCFSNISAMVLDGHICTYCPCVPDISLTTQKKKKPLVTFLHMQIPYKCICFVGKKSNFYAPASINLEHIVFGPSVCPSFCLFVCKNFYIGHSFRMVCNRAFIFQMYIPYKTFSLVPKSRSSVKVSVKYQGHSFRKQIGCCRSISVSQKQLVLN